MKTRFKLHNKTVWGELETRNVAKAVASFDGGNDSGGVNNILLILKDGTTSELKYHHTHNWTDGKYTKKALGTEQIVDNYLFDEIQKPIYQKWGSFAGDFYVEGQLIWDVATKEVHLVGDEEVKEYSHFHQTIEIEV